MKRWSVRCSCYDHRMHSLNSARKVYNAIGLIASTVVPRLSAINKARRSSVDELYNWQHLATIDLHWRNFLSPEFGTKFQGKIQCTLIFGGNRISLQHNAGSVEGSFYAINQLSPFSHFSRTSTCGRNTQTNTQTDRHKAI